MKIHLYARDAVASLRGSGPAQLNWLFLVSRPRLARREGDAELTHFGRPQVENIVVVILILFVCDP